jgi:predicted nuclease with TOPRIM domain
LAVNGTITTKEVVVTNTGWSDYVFAPDYHLQPLNEVGAYVKEHHHLPEIPSEAEVKEKGVSLGDMQAKLLAKVEELTLHMIQADERNTRLEQQNRELRDRVARLETRNPGQGPEKEQ